MGRRRWFAFAALWLTACTWNPRREFATPTARSDGSIGPEPSAVGKARRFAVQHLKCPASQISVQQVNAEMFQIGGCGRNATIFCAKGRKGECVADEEQPAPAKSEPEVEAFDAQAARSSLKSVTYSDCGVGGRGRVQLTFEPTGTTSTVNIVEGSYDENTTKCLLQRFGKVSVPPFSGAPRVIRWTIVLPEA